MVGDGRGGSRGCSSVLGFIYGGEDAGELHGQHRQRERRSGAGHGDGHDYGAAAASSPSATASSSPSSSAAAATGAAGCDKTICGRRRGLAL